MPNDILIKILYRH